MRQINLQKIVSVKGKPGLYHLASHNRKGFFIQPFEGGVTQYVANTKDKVLAMGNIDLKRKANTINLLDIFQAMEKNTPVPTLDESQDCISQYMKALIPDLDESVKFTHLLKIIKWYNLIRAEYREEDIVNNKEEDGLSIV